MKQNNYLYAPAEYRPAFNGQKRTAFLDGSRTKNSKNTCSDENRTADAAVASGTEKNKSILSKTAMFIRYITVAPVIASVLITILYACNPMYIGSKANLFFSYLFLCVFPLVSYPVHAIIPALKSRGRKCQRNLAVIFSVAGYAAGLIYALCAEAPSQLTAVFLTYLISGGIIAICTFLFKFKASGHASGVAGPVAALVLIAGPQYAVGILIFAAVMWASIFTGRHTATEFAAGAFFTCSALFLSMLITGIM